MSDTLVKLLIYGFCALVVAVPMILYQIRLKRREANALAAAAKGKIYSEGPRAQHPHIDSNYCIGCAICTQVCPEGDVLAMIGGKAAIVNGYKCIGHSLCAEACPVGAIKMVTSNASMSVDTPRLTPQYETTVPGLFVVGELGGLALIKNAINQGRDCIDTVGSRVSTTRTTASPSVYDVLIVGAGPAGISASLRAIEKKLNYLTIEQDTIGGTVSKYPRQKLVMTSPVQFPMYGNFKKMELSKEELLSFWQKILQRADFKIRSGEGVESIKKGEDGIFTTVTPKGQYLSKTVVLAIGRSGTPRKLGVKGEELPKVMYRPIEADHYVGKKILVVGGGDSAVEAAMGLAEQRGNKVTLSYRQDRFSRIKTRNAQRMEECVRKGKLIVLFNSSPVEIKPASVVIVVNGKSQEIPNDYVWVFAGGTPPNAFLQKIGVALGAHDLTLEAGKEAKEAALSKKQLVEAVH
ncbi:MAG TPA: NAD(P)-binding domain-containing protein [Candidatus Solibacter sp.]|nr:NAD(P)-binding domain-containing protein [Candidatus Solibacter sp.]